MDWLKKLLESKKSKEKRLYEFECYKRFCEMMKNRTTESVFFKRLNDNNVYCFYFYPDLYDRDEYNVGRLDYNLVVGNFPDYSYIDSHYSLISFSELMDECRFIFKEDYDKLMISINNKKNQRIKEIALSLKTGPYHCIEKSPTEKDYLFNIKKIYKCNKKYYIDVEESDIHKKHVEKTTYEINEWIIKHYKKGDGVEEIK